MWIAVIAVLTLVLGAMVGIVLMACLCLASIADDDPPRHAAADRLGLRPDQVEFRDGKWQPAPHPEHRSPNTESARETRETGNRSHPCTP